MQRFVLLLLLAGLPMAHADPRQPARITLQEAVERALNANPGLAAAEHRLRAARAAAATEQARLGLHASVGVVAGVSDRDTMLEAGGASAPIPSAMMGRRATAGLAGAAMVPIATGGALENRIRQAQAMVAAAEAELLAKRAEVVADVREAFFRARYAAAILRAAEADREASAAMAKNARAEWEAGRGIEATYLRARARERNAERGVASAKSEIASAVIELARAMGLKPDMPLEPVGDPTLDGAFPDVESAVRSVLSSSPMVLVAHYRQLAARHHAAAARAARAPQVYATLMGTLPGPSDASGRASATLGLTAVLPVLDGGMRDAAKRQADAEYRAALSDAQDVRQAIEADVRTWWSRLEAAQSSLAAARAAFDAARSAHAVIALRVENQKAILVEQLDALSAVREAEEALARARLDRELALVRILRLAGSVPEPKGRG